MAKIKWGYLLLTSVLIFTFLLAGCGGTGSVSSDPEEDASASSPSADKTTKGTSTTTSAAASGTASGSGSGAKPGPGSNGDQTANKTTTTTRKVQVVSKGALDPVGKDDFTYMWWPLGVKASDKLCNIATGNYGFQYDAKTAKIRKLGAFSSTMSQSKIKDDTGNSFIANLSDVVDMQYYMKSGGNTYKITEVDSQNAPDNALRVIESGTYMQHNDIWQMRFQGNATPARASFSAVSDYFTYSFYVDGAVVGKQEITLSVTMRFHSQYSVFKTYKDASGNNACSLANSSGAGFIFVSPKGRKDTFSFNKDTNTLTISETKILRQESDAMKLTWDGLDFICAPVAKVTDQQVQYHLSMQQVKVSAVHIEPSMKAVTAVYNTETGAYEIALPNTKDYSNMTQVSNQNKYGKMQITVENPTDSDLTVPINMYQRWSNGIDYKLVTGMSVIIRDKDTKEPTGHRVQLSKNWHGSDKTSLYKGPWFSGITYMVVPAGKKVQYEVISAYAKWGEAYAANHSQLSLSGYKSGSQSMLLWHTSGLGCFDQEAFCYDVDVSLGNAIINDVRILCVGGNGAKGKDPSLEGAKYVRTNEVGGGDFFVWYDKNGKKQSLSNMKVSYDSYGPNLTNVTFSGKTKGGEADVSITTNLPRTTDLNKCYMTFKYEFKKDLPYSRLAFFTCGAEGFNDHIWSNVAYGNGDGLIKDISLNTTKRYKGYLEGEDQAISVSGGSAWVAWYGPSRSTASHKHDSLGPLGNRGFAVRNYAAVINGKSYTSPSLSFYHTDHNKQPGVAAELVPPSQAGGVIKAGSVVTCTVEYLVFPQKKTDYYGPSAALKSLSASDFDSWKIGYQYATKGAISVSASKGTVTSSYPVSVKASGNSGVVADFTVKGGMGYVPMTITNLSSASGYRLYKVENGKETQVNQSLSGQSNDYWQCDYDAQTDKYSLTFNVEHIGTTATYRLKKVS